MLNRNNGDSHYYQVELALGLSKMMVDADSLGSAPIIIQDPFPTQAYLPGSILGIRRPKTPLLERHSMSTSWAHTNS